MKRHILIVLGLLAFIFVMILIVANFYDLSNYSRYLPYTKPEIQNTKKVEIYQSLSDEVQEILLKSDYKDLVGDIGISDISVNHLSKYNVSVGTINGVMEGNPLTDNSKDSVLYLKEDGLVKAIIVIYKEIKGCGRTCDESDVRGILSSINRDPYIFDEYLITWTKTPEGETIDTKLYLNTDFGAGYISPAGIGDREFGLILSKIELEKIDKSIYEWVKRNNLLLY